MLLSYTSPEFKMVFTKNSKGADPYLNAIIRRHEAYEAQEAEKMLRRYHKVDGGSELVRQESRSNINKYLKNSNGQSLTLQERIKERKNMLRIPKDDNITETDDLGNLALTTISKNPGIYLGKTKVPNQDPTYIGSHYNMSVLEREAQLLNQIPHRKNPSLKYMYDLRRITGEHPIMEKLFNGNYGDIIKYNPKKHNKLIYRNRNKDIHHKYTVNNQLTYNTDIPIEFTSSSIY